MAVRQYIGARYVTKIYQNSQDANSAEWEAGVAYEPLTLVTYNNSSYLSRTQVPATAGNPATAVTYWAITGFYNGQIANLQDQIDAINVTINDINDELINQKDKPQDMHVVLIGDSYGDDTTDWAHLIENMDVFRQVDVICGGGWGFTGKEGAQEGTTGPTLEWLTHFRSFVESKTQEYLDDIDTVFIMGGFNEIYSDKSVILTHMREFFDYAHQHVKASYQLMECGWCDDSLSFRTPQGLFSSEDVRTAITTKVIPMYAECPKYGCIYVGTMIPYLHNYSGSWDTSHYHPTQDAEVIMANVVINKLLDGEYLYQERQFQKIKVDNVETIVGTVKIDSDQLVFNGSNSRIAGHVANGVNANYQSLISETAKSDTNSFIMASRADYRNCIPCTIQVDSADVYASFAYFDTDGLHIYAPIRLETTNALSIRLYNASFSVFDC